MKKVFAHPREVVQTIIFHLVLSAVLTIFFQLEFWYFFIVLAVSFMIMFLVASFQETFMIITFDENGISNKYFSLKWEDLTSYKLCNTYLPRRNLFKSPKYGPTIIYFGFYNEDHIQQNSHKCIKLSASRKTLELLYKYGYNKSQGIRDLFAENSFDFGADNNFPRN